MSSLETQTVQICYSRYTEDWPASEIDKLAAQFPEPVRSRILRLKRPGRRQASIIGKLLLLHCLDLAGEFDFLSAMTWSPGGRPSLPLEGDFNITHTMGFVACARVSQGRVGIDAEPERSIKRELFTDFASPAELKHLQREGADRARDAVRLWVRKEAALKADGRGFAFGATDLDVQTDYIFLDGRHFVLQDLDFGPSLDACLASSARQGSNYQLNEIPLSELVSRMD